MSTIQTPHSLFEQARHEGSSQNAKVQLVRIYGPVIFSMVAKVVHHQEDAKDVAGDLILKLFVQGRAIKGYDQKSGKKFRAYLFRSVRNACINHFRKSRYSPQALPIISDLIGDKPISGISLQEIEKPHDVAFARSLLVEAMAQTREHYQKKRLQQHWRLFVHHIIRFKVLGIGLNYNKLLQRILQKEPCVTEGMAQELSQARDIYFPPNHAETGKITNVKRFLAAKLLELSGEHVDGFDSNKDAFQQIIATLAIPGAIDEALADNLHDFGLDDLETVIFVSRDINLEVLLPARPVDMVAKVSKKSWNEWLQMTPNDLVSIWKVSKDSDTWTTDLSIYASLFDRDIDDGKISEIKKLAKCGMDAARAECRNAAAVLYLLAIASGLVRGNRRLSTLTDLQLRHNIRRVVEQRWLDEKSKSTFLRLLDLL